MTASLTLFPQVSVAGPKVPVWRERRVGTGQSDRRDTTALSRGLLRLDLPGRSFRVSRTGMVNCTMRSRTSASAGSAIHADAGICNYGFGSSAGFDPIEAAMNVDAHNPSPNHKSRPDPRLLFPFRRRTNALQLATPAFERSAPLTTPRRRVSEWPCQRQGKVKREIHPNVNTHQATAQKEIQTA